MPTTSPPRAQSPSWSLRFPPRAAAVLAPTGPPGTRRNVRDRNLSTIPGPAGTPQGRRVRGVAHVPAPCRQASRDLGGAWGPATKRGTRFTSRLRLPFQTPQSNALPGESPNNNGGRGGGGGVGAQSGPPARGPHAPALGGRLWRQPPTCPPLMEASNIPLLSLVSF